MTPATKKAIDREMPLFGKTMRGDQNQRRVGQTNKQNPRPRTREPENPRTREPENPRTIVPHFLRKECNHLDANLGEKGSIST